MSKKKEFPEGIDPSKIPHRWTDDALGTPSPIDEKVLTKETEAAVAVAVKKHLAFKSRTEFDIALNASTDPNIVLLDGVTVKGGVLPEVHFETKPNGDIAPVADS